MAEKPRTRSAKIRASHGRAERLRREAGDARQVKVAPPRKRQDPARSDLPAKTAVRPRQARTLTHDRKPTSLHLIQERLERARAAADRRELQRLERETRNGFNQAGERRRDAARRVEFDRKRDALQAKERRVEEHQRRANIRRLDRKRDELKREFNQTADRRRDLARRAELDRRKALEAARQKDLQQRAAIEIEKEQKRRSADQQAAHRRETDAMRVRHKVERNSYRVNENTAMERHHHAIKGIDAREERELADFDGRRKGLAGRAAELIPGRRAENDQKRADMVRGYESERLNKHRDFEAYKERAFKNEMKAYLDRAHERKALMELHRTDRDTFSREQVEARPRAIEERTRVIERVDQVREQERERAQPEQGRENIRPSEEFARSASNSQEASIARDHAADRSEVYREAAHDIRSERVMERA